MASVRLQSCVLTVFLLNFFCCVVSCLYFHIADTEEKCFREEIPDDTVVIGNFRTQVYDEQRDEHLSPAQDLRTLVVVKDADDELVLSRSFGSDGKFIFTSRKAGGHQVCLRSDSSHLPLSTGRMLTVHLDIKVGERTNNYTKIAAEDKLTELQLRIRQLAEQVQQIQREQVYQRIREEYFREVTHSTNMWIFWWPVLRSLYVVGMIMWLTKSW
ncbi:transmembrane emp24 domain-containing protein 9 isoform X2 [Lates calcarifer]|uniref:Transmembrane emp24 domain-containing protein 9 isoform X1 n=1 Tax=Lates calcarifer TaxID=8187 RepID=A0A4W6G6N6_LATCA|nr:transmembrane emp24 domain-containing protein 9 isoform X1 [Lates calcarifer]XP_050928537.1 transmembrane emp24 domain-containing protein 9 isoform X2 [Lates calcarifer]